MVASISFCLLCAWAPQSRNTLLGWCSLTTSMMRSVKNCQPLLAWDAALARSTVMVVLSSNTPCSAQDCRQPCLGISMFRSRCNSL
ncbi:hypothetical protein D3C76_1467000 [compost metagenome]